MGKGPRALGKPNDPAGLSLFVKQNTLAGLSRS